VLEHSGRLFREKQAISAYDTATEEGTDAELTDFDDRPDDCDCWDADAELPCCPCYRNGFDVPNPSADER
jgi:hypothetical protein